MGRKAVTTENWIKAAKDMHGDRYDYSRSVYTQRDKKITIICRIHGEFEQHAGSHLAGCGCKECFTDTRKLSLNEYINRSMALYGDKFTYEKTEYSNAYARVTVNCSEHGYVTMSAREHLEMKFGCADCHAESKRCTTTEFIEKAKAIHGDKYDYLKVNYHKVDVPVTLICNSCSNEFNSIPNWHLRGGGCPKCAKTGFNTGSPVSHFYIVPVSGQETFTGFGITSVLTGRFKVHRHNIREANCFVSGDIVLVQSTGENIYNLEKYIKTTYDCKQSQVSGFKTESFKDKSQGELLQICVDWLTQEGLEYEVLTQKMEFSNDTGKCCSGGNFDKIASHSRVA